MIKGFLKRKRFTKFKFVLKKILLIQKFYKKRHNNRCEAAVKLQNMFRIFAAKRRYEKKSAKRKMRILKYLEETGQIKNINDPNLWDTLDLKKYNYPIDLEIDYSGMTEIEKNLDDELQSVSKSVKYGKALKKKTNQLENQVKLLKRLEKASNTDVIDVLLGDMKNELREKFNNPYSVKNFTDREKSTFNYSSLEMKTIGLADKRSYMSKNNGEKVSFL
jgi:hypothetical protein